MNSKILAIVFLLTPLPSQGQTMQQHFRQVEQQQYRNAEQRNHHRKIEERNRQTQYSPYYPNQQQFQGQQRPLQLDWDKILENF
jgi:hypothetical protein